MNEPVDPNKSMPGEGPYASPFGLGVVPRIFLLAASLIVAVVAGLMAWRGSRVGAPPTPPAQPPAATPSATITPDNQSRTPQIAKPQADRSPLEHR